jgi:hypothetical protein
MCQNPLGLYYLTTSKDLDDLREKFSFSYESVTLYELGKAQHGVDNPVPFNTSDPSAPAAEDGEESSSSHSNGLNLKEPTNKEEIGRVNKQNHEMLISWLDLITTMHDFSCQPYLTLIVILFDDAYSADKTCSYWCTGKDLSAGIITA